MISLDVCLDVQHSGGMAYHSYSDDERMAFTEHINNCLAADPVSAKSRAGREREGERERGGLEETRFVSFSLVCLLYKYGTTAAVFVCFLGVSPVRLHDRVWVCSVSYSPVSTMHTFRGRITALHGFPFWGVSFDMDSVIGASMGRKATNVFWSG